jgi:hypothetical protein
METIFDSPFEVMDFITMIALPPSESEAPRIKSICPPTPEYNDKNGVGDERFFAARLDDREIAFKVKVDRLHILQLVLPCGKRIDQHFRCGGSAVNEHMIAGVNMLNGLLRAYG